LINRAEKQVLRKIISIVKETREMTKLTSVQMDAAVKLGNDLFKQLIDPLEDEELEDGVVHGIVDRVWSKLGLSLEQFGVCTTLLIETIRYMEKFGSTRNERLWNITTEWENRPQEQITVGRERGEKIVLVIDGPTARQRKGDYFDCLA
jgi:hypothetical protein